MAGLLDFTQDPTTMGLLQAAAQMFNASGPSRMPTSFGQVLGAGLGGYTNTVNGMQDRKLQQAHDALVAQGLKLDVAGKQKSFDDANALRQALINYRKQWQPQPMVQQQMQQPSLPQENTISSPAFNETPRFANTMPQSQSQSIGQTSGKLSAIQKQINDLNGQADYLENQGISGDAYRAKAVELEKMKPKLSKTEVRMQNGIPVSVKYYDDGTSEVESGLSPAEKLHFQDTGGGYSGLDQYTGKPVVSGMKTQTQDSKASNALGWARLKNEKEQQVGGNEGVSNAAIVNAAARYNIDGTLPPMGMGKQAAAGRTAILNKAAELAASNGISSDDQRINQIGNKANTAAMSKLQQQQTMVGAFEKNFNKNADIALELSSKVDRTGVPLVNKWLNVGKRSIAGDADLAAYDQAIKSVSNEYAKIISGSMGNTATAQSEIQAMEQKLNSAQTPDQVNAVVNLMKRETQNRMAGFEEEKGVLRNSMGGKRQEQPAQQSPKTKVIGGKTYVFDGIGWSAQ